LSTQLKGCSNAPEAQQQRWSESLGWMHSIQVSVTADVAAARGRPVDSVRWVLSGVVNAGDSVVPVALLLLAGPVGREARFGSDFIALSLDGDGFPLDQITSPTKHVQQFKSEFVSNYRNILFVQDSMLQRKLTGRKHAVHGTGWVGLRTWLRWADDSQNPHDGQLHKQQPTAGDPSAAASSASHIATGLAPAGASSGSSNSGSSNCNGSSSTAAASSTFGGNASSDSSTKATHIAPVKSSSSSSSSSSAAGNVHEQQRLQLLNAASSVHEQQHLQLLDAADVYLLDVLRQLSAPAEQLRRLKAALQRLRQLPPGSAVQAVFERRLCWVQAWADAGCMEELQDEVQQLLDDVLAE
jgi:hypothetical protein